MPLLMTDLIKKLSSYNLFNYLLPGVVFVALSHAFTGYSFVHDNLLIAAFLYYFAVTTTPVKAARLYTRYRPPGLPLASDPTLAIHRAYGVPIYRIDGDRPTQWPQTLNPADLVSLTLNPSPELPEALPAMEAGARLDAEDGFEVVTTDEAGPPDDISPLISYFLIHRSGSVRWTHVVALDDPADYAQHPSPAELLAAAERLAAA